MEDHKITELVQRQRDYFNSHKTKDYNFRIDALKRLKAALKQNEDMIIDAVKRDFGKPAFEAYGAEVGIIYNDIALALKKLKNWMKPRQVKNPPINMTAKSVIYPEPYGLALIISPWNYPFQLLLSPLVGAIAAGNCCIIKPSELAPHSSAVVAKIIGEAFDPAYIAVVEGAVPETQHLLSLKFDYIFYTGSTQVGRIVMEAAAKQLTPVTLELGGKSPCIVEPDVDIDYAARRILWGKFINAGQTCIAPDYLLVQRDFKDQFLAALKKHLTEFFGIDPQQSPDYARIVNDSHFQRVVELMETGEIVVGGQTDAANRYIAPTIIEKVSLEDKVMQEEIFGPVLPVLEYGELSEAIDLINSRPRPLALYLFSRDEDKQQRMVRETSSGGICFNDTILHITPANLPFGGVGDSGMGQYHGRYSFDTFTHYKSTMRQTFAFDLKFRYPPYFKDLRIYKFAINLFG